MAAGRPRSASAASRTRPCTPLVLVDPGRTMRTFVPIAANACSTCALAPSPMATIAMTAPTPMMMPSVVRNERSLLRRMRAERDAEGVEGVHARPRLRGRAPRGSCRVVRRARARPASTTTREANAAMSGSWVTRTTVIPARQSSWKSAITSTLVRESRLPVGSSARMTFGLVDERARDRHALLLAARELVRVVVRRSPRPDALERLRRPRAPLARRTPRVTAAARRSRARSCAPAG